MKLFQALVLALLLSYSVLAVEAKEVGASEISLHLQWIITGDVDGLKTFKTFGFPNTSFQSTSIESNTPYTVEKDSFGNDVLVFTWTSAGEKDIDLRVVADVNYDALRQKVSLQEADQYAELTDLIVVDNSIATQEKLLSQGAQSNFEKLARFTDWVHNAITYDDSFWQKQPTTQDIFRSRRGVCNQYAHLDMALLRSANIPARFVAGWVYSGTAWGPHAWLEAYVNGEWVPADATYGEAGALDGTHVVFAYGMDQSDIKEQLTRGMSMRKIQSLEFVSFVKPRKYFDVSLKTPLSVGSSASEKLVVSLSNNEPREIALPVILIVPTQPPELAITLAEPNQRLVYLPPRGVVKVEWNALFPKLEDNFVYNFSVQARVWGEKKESSVAGESNVQTLQKQALVLLKLESIQSDSDSKLAVTLTNAGNQPAAANVSVTLGSEIQDQEISLSQGEEKTLLFSFSKNNPEKSGVLKVSSASGEILQPFELGEAITPKPSSGVVETLSDNLTVIIAAVVVLLALLAYAMLKSRTPPSAT